MKKKRVKRFILSSLFVLFIVASFFSISLINNMLVNNLPSNNLSTPILKEVTQAVVSEVKEDVFYKPYSNEKVSINVSFYDKNASDEEKTGSLIYYEKTYMPSTGVMYTCPEDFEVLAIYSGEVTNVKNDEILGTMVEITHNTNLVTYYYSLKETTVSVGDTVKSGDVIAMSNSNKINNDSSLFVECYYQGKLMNPESLYLTDPSELQ